MELFTSLIITQIKYLLKKKVKCVLEWKKSISKITIEWRKLQRIITIQVEKNTNNKPHNDIYDTLFAILKILCNLVLEMNTYFTSFITFQLIHVVFFNLKKKTPTKFHVTCIFKILTKEVVCTLTLNNETIQKP